MHAETIPDDRLGALEDEPTFADRLVRFLRRASIAGLAISLIVHLTLALVSSLLIIDRSRAATAEAMDEGFEFAIMTEQELTDLQDAALMLSDPSVPEVPVPEVVEQELLDAPDPTDLANVLDHVTDFGPMTGGGDLGDGSAIGAGGTGSGGANFFGVEAQGNRFAYVIDVSGSMAYGGKMEGLRVALAKSIDSLGGGSQFVVVLYSGDAWPLGGRAEWKDASDRGKEWARRLISQINPSGATNPTPAFAEVFGVRPRPDAIYFMTDGEFPADVATEIASLNAQGKVPIHCISFVSRQAEAVMREIASRSGGSYTHVPAPGGP